MMKYLQKTLGVRLYVMISCVLFLFACGGRTTVIENIKPNLAHNTIEQTVASIAKARQNGDAEQLCSLFLITESMRAYATSESVCLEGVQPWLLPKDSKDWAWRIVRKNTRYVDTAEFASSGDPFMQQYSSDLVKVLQTEDNSEPNMAFVEYEWLADGKAVTGEASSIATQLPLIKTKQGWMILPLPYL